MKVGVRILSTLVYFLTLESSVGGGPRPENWCTMCVVINGGKKIKDEGLGFAVPV